MRTLDVYSYSCYNLRMKIRTIAIFAYGFPHKKTQDFLLRLYVEGYHIKYVIAAPWKDLRMPVSSIKVESSHVGLIHPKKICKKFGIRYIVAPHEKKLSSFLKRNPVDLFIISGARILPKEIIEACNNNIVNIHPGLLPDIRGLDPLQWCIFYDKPIGITAHFIGKKIDAGLLIYKERLELEQDDTPVDIYLRLLEKQNDVLITALNKLKDINKKALADLDLTKYPYGTKMNENLEKKVFKKFPEWLKKFAKSKFYESANT